MKRKSQKPKPKDQTHQFRDPSFQAQQGETLETKKARIEFFKHSYDCERAILKSRGW